MHHSLIHSIGKIGPMARGAWGYDFRVVCYLRHYYENVDVFRRLCHSTSHVTLKNHLKKPAIPSSSNYM